MCILRHDPPRETQVSQVRPEVRVATDHGKSRRNRQATRLGGNLVAREATFTGGGSGRGNCCAGPAFVLPVRLERTEPECITPSGSGDAVEKLLNMHKLY